VLNESDTDYETAIALGVETATESPFSPISAGARNRAAAMIIAADTVLVTDVPFGSGNLPNLELAIEAQQTGKQVVLIDHGDSETRDYTGGIATRLMADLLQHGAQRCDTIEEWTRSVH
jgi:iron complex transport system ATP-binding protein